MADEIIDGDTFNWAKRRGASPLKGRTKYQHLLDGNARLLEIGDYGHTDPGNFLTVLRKSARDRGLTFRSSRVDEKTVAFQVTGRRDG